MRTYEHARLKRSMDGIKNSNSIFLSLGIYVPQIAKQTKIAPQFFYDAIDNGDYKKSDNSIILWSKKKSSTRIVQYDIEKQKLTMITTIKKYK